MLLSKSRKHRRQSGSYPSLATECLETRRLLSAVMDGPESPSEPNSTEAPSEPFRQTISTGHDVLTVATGDVFQFPVLYQTTDEYGHAAQLQSNVFDFNLHFDAAQLSFLGFAQGSEFLEGRIASGSQHDESHMSGNDGDESTSRIVRTSFSATGGFLNPAWPSQPGVEPLTLFVAQFRVLPGFSGSTRINFSTNGSPVVYKQPAEFEFSGQSLTLRGDSEPANSVNESSPQADASVATEGTNSDVSGEAGSENSSPATSSQPAVSTPAEEDTGIENVDETGSGGLNSETGAAEVPPTVQGPIRDTGLDTSDANSGAHETDRPVNSSLDGSSQSEAIGSAVENPEDDESVLSEPGDPSLIQDIENKDASQQTTSEELPNLPGEANNHNLERNVTPETGRETRPVFVGPIHQITPPLHGLPFSQFTHDQNRVDPGTIPDIGEAFIPELANWGRDERLPVFPGSPTEGSRSFLIVEPSVSVNNLSKFEPANIATVDSVVDALDRTAGHPDRSIRATFWRTKAATDIPAKENNDASQLPVDAGLSNSSVGSGELNREDSAGAEDDDAVSSLVAGQIDEIFSEFAQVFGD